MEKNLRTPEGSLTRAEWEEKSNLVIRAKHPALRTYCIPQPGITSRFDIFWKVFTAYRKVTKKGCSLKRALLKRVPRFLNEHNEKTFVTSVEGKQVDPPDGKTTNVSNLFEKGVSLKVDMNPGSIDLKL